MRKFIVAIFIAGLVLVVGSIGAMEVGNISIFQTLLQSILGIGMCIPYTLKYGR